MPKDHDTELRKDVLLASVGDVQHGVSAVDSKVSGALVVHGLLFAGTVNMAPRIASVYKHSAVWQQWVMGLLLLGAVATFLTSVGWLLWALAPVRPAEVGDTHPRSIGVFFPIADHLKGPSKDPVEILTDRVSDLTWDNVVDELTFERAKLAFMYKRQSTSAKVGYAWLFGEVATVVTLLTFVGGVAASQVGQRKGKSQPVPAPPSLSALELKPSMLRVAHGTQGHKVNGNLGTLVSFNDTQAATSIFSVLQFRQGVRNGDACVAAGRPTKPKPNRCRLTIELRIFIHRDHAGANHLHLSARNLAPGAYKLRVFAVNAAGKAGTRVSRRFSVRP